METCIIRVGNREIQGARCPVCKGLRYPAESVAICIERHERLAALHNCRLCAYCHEPRPKKEFKTSKDKLCAGCRVDLTKRERSPYRRGHGLEYQEYLSGRAYTWAGNIEAEEKEDEL